jgi:uncharacterized membrane protein YoaK (UPF0700 family)
VSDRLHVRLMLVLTFTTGINDAIGYLGLHRVFTGNMTGNVVVLGMALVGGTGLPVVGPALALVGFMAGAAGGGRALRRASAGWSTVITAIFGFTGVLLIALGVSLLVVGNAPRESVMVTITTLAAVGMGAQAAAARHLAVKDVTTVVVTSTITGLAADSILGSGAATWRGGGTARRAAAVVAIIAGAVVGAALWKWRLGPGLLLAGVIVATVAAVGGARAAATPAPPDGRTSH